MEQEKIKIETTTKKKVFIVIKLITIGIIVVVSAIGLITLMNKESSEQTFIDLRDGNKYKIVQIGNQIWMAEDLRYKCANFKNVGIESAKWRGETDACAPQGADYKGLLYQWDIAMGSLNKESSQDLCPEGWHIPSDDEWEILALYIGIDTNQGTRLKETVKKGPKEEDGTNEYGFAALLPGYRCSEGILYSEGSHVFWWSSTEDGDNVSYRGVRSGLPGFYWTKDSNAKARGYSIRCLMD